MLPCDDGWRHACGPDLQFSAGRMWTSAGKAAGILVVGQCGVGACPTVVRVVGGPTHSVAHPFTGAGWALRPAYLTQVSGTLGGAVLAALEVAVVTAPPSGQRGGDRVVCIRFVWVRPDPIPGWVGVGEPGVPSSEDNVRGWTRIVGVAADPGWAAVRVNEDGAPGVVFLYVDVGRRPEPRSGVAVIVDEDDPSVWVVGTGVSDAIARDSGAPR